ncbi:Adaptor protein complex AP-1 gamma subunit [Rhizoctonia solani]|uniref:Adaptor protein complex AP-1 gamma subunit n=1 Tax=Rhizoctonia solani TaxID=456999 RepID=A0A8H7I8R3_9AGAM|nr:Adaptor protein complex AP-1 gamma subunit [Rhizoctonia solani]
MSDHEMEVDDLPKDKGKQKEAPEENFKDDTLPWVEKYRPVTLSDVVSHQDITSTIERFIEKNRLPHLLFYGPPGTGKTSTIVAVARRIYGNDYKKQILELNASDDRGIEVVREQIKQFAETRTWFKLIILDEADMMTQAAQAALRRVIEQYTRNVRFCIICNYVNKIPLPSVPMHPLRFSPCRFQSSWMEYRVNITPEGKQALLKLSKGDMRRALNVLQASHAAYDRIDESEIYTCTVTPPLPTCVSSQPRIIFSENLTTRTVVMKMKTERGLALQDLLSGAYEYFETLEFPPAARVHLLDKLATIEHWLSTVGPKKFNSYFSPPSRLQLEPHAMNIDNIRAAVTGPEGSITSRVSLIKGIRACKTLADERALIQKESAAIRTSFKEEDSLRGHNNIAKLLYIHMLGYPAHFGQIECLKLVASPRFSDKRLGYLGIMLLLDENQEVLMLVTNSLKNDMNHSNMYAVGLALCTFANIAGEEMSRDLCNEVEKLLGSSNTYIRKKAALCALRIVRRVPELLDHFIDGAKGLLTDRNHGVLLSGVTLVSEMCQLSESCLDEFRKASDNSLGPTPQIPHHNRLFPRTRCLGNHRPFLQIKILRLLRQIGKNDPRASEAMNDILAQTVLTVLEIEADSGLRVMAINILGKFLSNRDNNIRYVALNTLNKVVTMDTNAVQRHRNIILDCLRDGDISIRRRALELSYALINESNVRVLTRELLAFLEVADNEFKLGMTTQISLAAERFAPNKRWHIDTVLRVLKLTRVPYTRTSGIHDLEIVYRAQRGYSQESLTLATVWLLGEFGEALIQGGLVDEETPKPVPPHIDTDSDIVEIQESILQSPYANALIRQFVLTSLAKLSSRPAVSEPQRQRIFNILNGFATSTELEIQQRAADIRGGVLEVMPPPEIKATVIGTVSERRSVGSTRTDKDPPPPPAQSNTDLLADLFGGGGAAPAPAAPAPQKNSIQDILGLFDSTPVTTATPPPAPMPTTNGGGLGGLFDSTPSPAPVHQPQASDPHLGSCTGARAE